jgi:CubicO group peptidase (beta-lactamase class C family)
VVELRQKYRLPSLSLAVGRDDLVVFAGAVGYADLAEERHATPSTQYSVASLAKPMTAIALARLASLGLLDLDETVSTYLRRPPYVDRFTVRELASHLASIPHDTAGRHDAEFTNPADRRNPFEVAYVFEAQELLSEPGTDFHYSSDGYILLSALIEGVAQEGFLGFLAETLWPALGMSDTELDISTAGEDSEATYYAEFHSDKDFTEATLRRDRSFLFGAGGFLSTPTDMVRMARATYASPFLSEDARQAFYAPTSLRDGAPSPGDYSLGWRVGRVQLGSGTAWLTLQHAGLMEGAASSYLFVVPECKQAIAFATNHVSERFWELYGEVERLLKRHIEESECRRFS